MKGGSSLHSEEEMEQTWGLCLEENSEIVQFYLSGSFISLDKMKQKAALFALLEDLTSGNKAIVQSIVSHWFNIYC